MLDQQGDLGNVVRSQLTTLEALNRVARIRARIRATMDAIARAEEKIRLVRELLADASGPARRSETLREHEATP
jgi:hypothetical protein